MSVTQSNLTAYGYDVVVATTQASINAVMKPYLLAAKLPSYSLYYVKNPDNGYPMQISRTDLLAKTNGVDPLDVPAWDGTGEKPAAVTLLEDILFGWAFSATIGIPPGYAPSAVPDVVVLTPGSESVSFTLMCSQFQIVTWGADGVSWFNQSQPDGDAWLFNASINLSTVISDNNLSQAVKNAVKNLGSAAFSIQQLLFDFDTALSLTQPVISGVSDTSELYAALTTDFLGVYFSSLKADNGGPVLNYAITQPATENASLTLSDIELNANTFLNPDGTPVNPPTKLSKALTTLNYLCSVDGHVLPAAQQLNWNWLDTASDATSYHGAMAVNRSRLIDYFKQQLDTYVATNCITPTIGVSNNAFVYGSNGGGVPTVTMPATGPTVLQYGYTSATASNQYQDNGNTMKSSLYTNYTVDVIFQGNTILINQEFTINGSLNNGGNGYNGAVVDTVCDDTYTLEVDGDGNLGFGISNVTIPDDPPPFVGLPDDFVVAIEGMLNAVEDWADSCVTTNIKSAPVSITQQFVFPGGNSFTIKDAQFSDNQDLVCHITYASTN